MKCPVCKGSRKHTEQVGFFSVRQNFACEFCGGTGKVGFGKWLRSEWTMLIMIVVAFGAAAFSIIYGIGLK